MPRAKISVFVLENLKNWKFTKLLKERKKFDNKDFYFIEIGKKLKKFETANLGNFSFLQILRD